jgi:RNA polymerase sigma-70 factor (ECF subfamily)
VADAGRAKKDGMLDDTEIKRLLLQTAGRDASAFEQLYRRTAPLLLGIALRIAGRREIAEEVLHDAFAKIWRVAGTFDPLATQPVAWMAAIVRNRALDLKASADVERVELLGDDADAVLDRFYEAAGSSDEQLGQERVARWLRNCLDGLAAVERQVLVLAYHHGLSHSELAAHLVKPLGTVKTWARRGLANLRACVEDCMETR